MDPKLLRKIIREELEPVKKTQEKHTQTLGEHSKVLAEHTNTLGEHTRILGEHTKTLGENTKILGEHTGKIDSITVELHHVHQLASTTLDVVKGRYENNKREIDEIKDHLHLPKEPFFGEQP